MFPPATITIERYSTLTLAPLVTYPIIYNTIFIISLGGDSIATVFGHNWRLFYKRVSNYDLTFGEEVLFVQQLSVFPCRLKLKFVLQQLLVGAHHSDPGKSDITAFGEGARVNLGHPQPDSEPIVYHQNISSLC